MSEWNFACPDWAARLAAGKSLLPNLPLDQKEADRAVAIFNKLRLPDVPGQPTMGEAAAEWQRDVVRAIFGSLEDGRRRVAEILAMVPKKSNKTTMGAALTIVALLMNERPRAEMVYVGPTQEIAETAFSQAVGMIDADPYLVKRFHVQHNTKTITDRRNKTRAKIKTFDMKVVTGSKPVFVLLDELHLMAAINGAARIIGQIRGGMLPNPEAAMVMITTQSDIQPAGVFLEELKYARGVRDGRQPSGRMLPILYEFPEAMQRDEAWRDPKHWHMVSPSLNRPVTLDDLVRAFEEAQQKGEAETRRWASQHLNIEIGLGLHSDAWAGAEYWLAATDKTLTLQEVIRRSEVIVVGIDGGGLDDLLGLAVMGREIGTGVWLLWSHAWAHEIVKERRKDIAPRLEDFEKEGSLTFVKLPGEDVYELADFVMEVERSGKLAEEAAIGVDSFGVTDIVKELTSEERGIDESRIVGIPQGWQLNGAIKTAERNLAGGTLKHSGLALMAWAVGNAKVEPRGNAISITKQVSGTAKIDPLMAALNTVVLMGKNPTAGGVSVYDRLGAHSPAEPAPSNDIDMHILADPRHPRWLEMRDRYDRRLALVDEDDF